MSSLAERPQGIPIPLDEIRSALASVAIPGFTGVLQLEIHLAEAAAQHISFCVIRRQSFKVAPAPLKQTLPDTARKKPVEKVLDDIKGRLVIRSLVQAVEVHFDDGVAQRFTVLE